MSHRAKVWVSLWTVYVIWGSTYLGIELAGETIPPLFAAATRFIASGAILAAYVRWRRGARPLRVTRKELAAAAFVGCLLPGANGVLFVAEQKRVDTGLAALIFSSIPLWVVVLRLVARERPDRIAALSVVLGFAGIAVLTSPGGHASVGALLLVVLAAGMWAVGSFVSRYLPMPKDAFASNAYQMLAGGIAMLPVSLLVYSPHRLDPSGYSARSIGGFWYLVTFGSVVGYTAYGWLLANAPIGQVATYAYVNPVIAIALGAAVLHEHVGWRIGIGAAIVLASVAVVVRRESRVATRVPERA